MTDTAKPQANTTLDRLIGVLNRRERIPALEALAYAVKGGSRDVELSSSAIVLDANVFLRIPSHRKSSDIIDYILGIHEKPIVVPGQAIQEFWNNQLNATDTVYKKISKKHSEMSKELESYKQSGVSGVDVVSDALNTFKISNEHVFEPELISKISSFLDSLIVKKALVPFAPRSSFSDLAVTRKRAKTPPGFRDEGDGDFLVWVDMLWGLSEARREGVTFDNVILLSNDAKIDWCRGNMAHPVLAAELKAVLGAHFEIWTLDRFAEVVG